MVTLLCDSGHAIKVGALLDSGAQSIFVTEWVAQQLHTRLIVSFPNKPSLRLPTKALVLRSLTSLLPPERVRTISWPHLSGLELADPAYDIPAPVDAVLGSDVYDLMIKLVLRHGPSGSSFAQLTAFDLSRVVQRLWELEEVSSQSPPTPNEIWAEQRREGEVKLDDSRQAEITMLLNFERRLGTKTELRKRYVDFMVEYLAFSHMDLVSPEALTARESYYLPHHAVFKAGDSSNKIQVIFSWLFSTTSGYSLNNTLLPGPRLQSDDADLQRILWRADPSEEVRDYRFTIITYGTASAPFLTLRTLQQLVQDKSSRFSRGSEALGRHSYVDNILARGDSPDEARDVQE
ncbi:uncharacterized protein LOC105199548 [Solenopsis invicta]|uniref:uncharacterized protein LOC105199548 n=1 Tax=Solenopsis invicta TaxID=13686 RepID=UPI000595E222|nr:uncharacterized protein LOC105199548 [Solenopsis invicta]